jgi:glycosyltransferase involved in cell wall biosynthesis
MADLPAAARKVCILAHSHPDFSKGGGEMAAHRQFHAMRAAGREAVFVGACDVGTQYAAQRPIETIIEHAKDDFVFSFAGMAEDRLGWDDPYQRRMIVEFLAGLGSDVYHFHHYWRLGVDMIHDLMQARPDATFVMTLHEMLAICLHHGQMIKTRSRELCRRESPLSCLACFPDQTLERFAFRKATLLAVLRRFDHIIYPSEFVQDRYAAWGLKGRPASVLENFLGDDLMASPRIPADAERLAARFGFFGQPTPFKGLDILLRALPLALRENPGITVTVFGAEREDVLRFFPVLEPIIEATGQSLSFAGRYDPMDAVELMRSVGWAVVPSIWWENSPVVIQEARRAGTPLIVADIGGMAEKVAQGVDGMHFKRASPVDLARAMLDAADPARRTAYGASVRDVIGREAFLAGLDLAFAPHRVAPLAREAAE